MQLFDFNQLFAAPELNAPQRQSPVGTQELQSLAGLEAQIYQSQLTNYKDALMKALRIKEEKEFDAFCTEHKYNPRDLQSLQKAKESVMQMVSAEIRKREQVLRAQTESYMVFNDYLSTHLEQLSRGPASLVDRAIVSVMDKAHQMAPDMFQPVERRHFYARMTKEAFASKHPVHPLGCFHSVPQCTEQQAMGRAIRNHMEYCCKMKMRKAGPIVEGCRKRKRKDGGGDDEEKKEKRRREPKLKTRSVYVGLLRCVLTEHQRFERALAMVRYGRSGPIRLSDFAVVPAESGVHLKHPLVFGCLFKPDETPRSTACLAWNRLETCLTLNFPNRPLGPLADLRKLLHMTMPQSLEHRIMQYVTQQPHLYLTAQAPPIYDPFEAVKAEEEEKAVAPQRVEEEDEEEEEEESDKSDDDEESMSVSRVAFHAAKRVRFV